MTTSPSAASVSFGPFGLYGYAMGATADCIKEGFNRAFPLSRDRETVIRAIFAAAVLVGMCYAGWEMYQGPKMVCRTIIYYH